jgi:hypothetical protein
MLLIYGANVNHIDLNCQNILFYAVDLGNFELVNFLINKGIDINQLDREK